MGQEDRLDVVVVGAGLSGLACADALASAGLQVAVLERGDAAGAKNLSGGRLYLEPVRELCGELLDGAPFERQVVSESVVLCGADSALSLRLDQARAPESVTVLRARLDKFLAERVGGRGALMLYQQRADSLVRGAADRVCGVKVGGEELPARLVVAADGALSFLAQEAGLRSKRPPEDYAVGIKEIVRLEAPTIEARFGLAPGQGAARLYLGEVTRGLAGGGFLYTNRDSISLGLVIQLRQLADRQSQEKLCELLEGFKQRPEIAPLVAGGATVEYGAHLVPEGGYRRLPELGAPGLLPVGDAAGLVLNAGFTVRGMDLALASGALAGRAIASAFAEGKEDEVTERYRTALSESFVLRELRKRRRAPRALAADNLYLRYPQRAAEACKRLFAVGADGATASPRDAFRKLKKEALSFRGLRDLWRLWRM